MSKENKTVSKGKQSKVIQIPIRVDIKSNGRLQWDVSQVHKLLAKHCAADTNLCKAKMLVKKDSDAIQLTKPEKTEKPIPISPKEKK